ncbi:MAG: sulfotransferase domain-containing protein [Caldilineaceae bacterium]
MTAELPKVTRTYQNHTLDSTRWQRYQPRAGDIVIATSYKSGTTWMQEIVRQLIFLGQDVPERDRVSVKQISPWLEHPGVPVDEVLNKLETQQHRRFLMCHIPLDGLPFFPQMHYIVVGRDARDVAMSLWNHYDGMVDSLFKNPNSLERQDVAPLPPPPQDIHAFWHQWITRGWFAWEREGYPFYGNLHHTQSWWNYRHLPNILFVHYNDLKADLAGEIRQIADFLGIAVDDTLLPSLLQTVSLDVMREREERLKPPLLTVLKNGANTFFYKGTNGRWRDVLSTDELQLYEAKAAEVLTPDCRAWLEQGRQAGL